jgi:hypothetical protein
MLDHQLKISLSTEVRTIHTSTPEVAFKVAVPVLEKSKFERLYDLNLTHNSILTNTVF